MVQAPGGEPAATVRLDYTSKADTGVFSQLATIGRLQGPGTATTLIGAGEQRVHASGLDFAAPGVQDTNPRARHLYPAARILAGEGVVDAPAGGGPDALVDGQGLAQERGGPVVVAVVEMAVAGSFLGACLSIPPGCPRR